MTNPAGTSQEDDETKETSIQLIEPTGSGHYFVPRAFQNQIKLHYIKSTMPELRSPLILAIQGATGQGKTFQCLETFSQMGVYVLLIFGFELSGKYEGGPVRKMQRLYDLALNNQNELRRPTAVVIDDFDNSIVSVRSDGHSGYSVNTQLLTDYFMNLPRKIPSSQVPVPIIVTGNSFLDIYEPLVRYGRMSFFDWNGPTGADRIGIVRRIFAGALSDSELMKIEQVIETFRDQNLAFFNELRNATHDTYILAMCNAQERLNIPDIHASLRRRKGQLTVAEVVEVGQMLINNRPNSFLSPGKTAVHGAKSGGLSDEPRTEGETQDE